MNVNGVERKLTGFSTSRIRLAATRAMIEGLEEERSAAAACLCPSEEERRAAAAHDTETDSPLLAATIRDGDWRWRDLTVQCREVGVQAGYGVGGRRRG